MVQREDREDTLDAPCPAQQMARHGLGRTHDHIVGMVAKGGLDGIGFVEVTQRGGRAMRVEIVHLIGIDPGIAVM